MPKISVILPQYGHRAYLMDAVQSIINQTFQDWELIILNDEPGTDLDDYEKLDRRISVYRDRNRRGQPDRLNQGINLARGEFIAFQDADDMSISQRLGVSLRFMTGNILDVVYGDCICLKRDDIRSYTQAGEWDPELLKKRTFTCFSSIMVRREIALECPFDESIGYGNDRIWLIDVAKVTNKIARIPIPLYYHPDYTSVYRGKYNFDIRLGRKINSFFARIEKRHKRRILQRQVDARWAK